MATTTEEAQDVHGGDMMVSKEGWVETVRDTLVNAAGLQVIRFENGVDEVYEPTQLVEVVL